MDRKFASMDKLHSQEETERFLRGLGLKVQEEKVRIVVETLQGNTSRSKYDLWAYGISRGGGERNPICGKGTVYKIENLLKEGKLELYLAHLAARQAGCEPLQQLQSEKESGTGAGSAPAPTPASGALLRTIPDEWPEGYLRTTKDTLHGKAAMRWTTARPQQAGDEFTLNLGQEVPLKAVRFWQGRQHQWDHPKRWQITFSNNQQIIEEVDGKEFIEVEREESTPVQWIGVVIVEPRLPTDHPPATCWAVDNIELE
jgi:hypothetical protein